MPVEILVCECDANGERDLWAAIGSPCLKHCNACSSLGEAAGYNAPGRPAADHHVVKARAAAG
jgi:hypothetical protein